MSKGLSVELRRTRSATRRRPSEMGPRGGFFQAHLHICTHARTHTHTRTYIGQDRCRWISVSGTSQLVNLFDVFLSIRLHDCRKFRSRSRIGISREAGQASCPQGDRLVGKARSRRGLWRDGGEQNCFISPPLILSRVPLIVNLFHLRCHRASRIEIWAVCRNI